MAFLVENIQRRGLWSRCRYWQGQCIIWMLFKKFLLFESRKERKVMEKKTTLSIKCIARKLPLLHCLVNGESALMVMTCQHGIAIPQLEGPLKPRNNRFFSTSYSFIRERICALFQVRSLVSIHCTLWFLKHIILNLSHCFVSPFL